MTMSNDIETANAEAASGKAVLPDDTVFQEDAGELTVAELTAMDWEGDGILRYSIGDLADARHDNTIRAGMALAAVQAYTDRSGGIASEPVEQQISDLLGSLMHLADALGLDFEELTQTGRFHYAPETRGDL